MYIRAEGRREDNLEGGEATRLPRQPEMNIGTIGHVDHGKTTLVQALTGIWAARHSEELKRGITIKLGYADGAIYKCPNCDEPECYSMSPSCPVCGSECEFRRAVSFVDAPGHEILMATMLSGAAVMDGAILVIAADEPCPQPQTREHLAAIDIIGVKNIVIVQNKIDIVTKEEARRNYEEILRFVEGTSAEGAPIIPVSAQHKVNIDLLIQAIEEHLPTPHRDPSKPPRMYIVRSFDVNRPGTPIEKLTGGVIGGSILQGSFKVGEEIEIRPGLTIMEKGRLKAQELYTEIVSLHAGGGPVEEAKPGGLVGVGTTLDPSLTKSDGLVGSLAGRPGTLPPVLEEMSLDIQLFETVVGSREMQRVEQIRRGERLLFNIGTAKTMGVVTHISKDHVEAKLTIPVCGEEGDRVAISRNISGRWRLIGVGLLR
ncbi:translation initiation factor IF-2 subunit gamma [Candidatus Bathyarchaeota archaeon]|nr:translation initiation factor IF-2 subunit gamma [Candidatus Bathyarchaeota archaeon]